MNIIRLLSQSTPPTSPGPVDSFWSGEVAAAFAAAGVALTAAIVTVIVQVKMSRRQQTHEMAIEKVARSFSMQQREIDWRVRQLNELYGPLRMLRATSKRLRQSLPSTENGGERWRLVRHIPEAKSNPGYRMIVDAILGINKSVEDLLTSKAGLMEEGQIPQSFEQFMHHSLLLRLAWQKGAPMAAVGRRLWRRGRRPSGLVDVSDVPFPDEFDSDIQRVSEAVQAALRKARSEQ